jgi:hypothetical protein
VLNIQDKVYANIRALFPEALTFIHEAIAGGGKVISLKY